MRLAQHLQRSKEKEQGTQTERAENGIQGMTR